MPLPSTDLLRQFSIFLEAHGLRFDDGTKADALAAYLSSQILMFAGPSGTGKSSLAGALSHFFADRRARIEAEPGLVRPADLTGYPSVLTGRAEFVGTLALERLLVLEGATESPPVVLVEEANLSPIEGYLGAFTHQLGALAAREMTFDLHRDAHDMVSRGNLGLVPPTLRLAPYPRLLLTLNVDATAPSPANKVVARACVLLLEPPDLDVVFAEPPVEATTTETPPASGVAGHPGDCLLAAIDGGEDGELRDALKSAFAVCGERRISPRMAYRSLQYAAAYLAVVAGTPALEQHALVDAAQNALLHFVLPLLDPREFLEVAQLARRDARPGGALARRLDALPEAGDDLLGFVADDFWTGLT